MIKKSFIYFCISVITLLILVAIFILTGILIGPSFWEYSLLIMPVLTIPSIVLSFIGTKYARKARRDIRNTNSLLAVICNTVFLICLLLATLLLLLFILLIFSFAG